MPKEFSISLDPPLIVYLSIAILLAFAFIPYYGANWDLGVHLLYGEVLWKLIQEGLPFSVLDQLNTDIVHYPPLLDFIGHCIIATLEIDPVLVRNAMTAIFWVLGLPPILWMAGLFGGRKSQWLVGMAYIVNPVIFGHGMMNHKDMPMATMLLWFILSLSHPPKTATLRIVTQALCFATLLTARPGAFVFGILFFLQFRRNKAFLSQTAQLLATLGIAYSLLVLFWPYCYNSPLFKPLQAIIFNLRFPDEHMTVFFGAIKSTELPRYYLLTYLLISVPIAQIVAAPLGIVGHLHLKKYALAALALPLIAFFISPPNMYGGIRHMLFLFPLIALFAGLGLARLPNKWNVLALAILLLPLGSVLGTAPYQYVYYSPLVHIFGRENFERDYWGLSLAEAAKYLNTVTKPEDKVIVFANALGVSSFTLSYRHPLQVTPRWYEHKYAPLTSETPRAKSPPTKFFVSTPMQPQDEFTESPVIWSRTKNGEAIITIKTQEY